MKVVLQWPNNGPVCDYSLEQLQAEFRGGKFSADCKVRRADGRQWISLRQLFEDEMEWARFAMIAPAELKCSRNPPSLPTGSLLRRYPVLLGIAGGITATIGLFILIELADPAAERGYVPELRDGALFVAAIQMFATGLAIVAFITGPWIQAGLKSVPGPKLAAITLALIANFLGVFAALASLDRIGGALAALLLPALLLNRRTLTKLQGLAGRGLFLRQSLSRKLLQFLETPVGRAGWRILAPLWNNRILQTWLLGLSVPLLVLTGYELSYYLFVTLFFVTPFPLAVHRRGKVTFLPALLLTLLSVLYLRLGILTPDAAAEYWNLCFEAWWRYGGFLGDFLLIPIAAAFLGCSAASAAYQLIARFQHRNNPPTNSGISLSAVAYQAFFLTVNLAFLSAAVGVSRWLKASQFPPFQDGLYHEFGLFPSPPSWVYRILASPDGLIYVLGWTLVANLTGLVLFRMVRDRQVIAPAAFLSFVLTGFPALWAVVAALMKH